MKSKNKLTSTLPKRGTASDVAGIVSATMLRKTVRDNRIVTPVKEMEKVKLKNKNCEKQIEITIETHYYKVNKVHHNEISFPAFSQFRFSRSSLHLSPFRIQMPELIFLMERFFVQNSKAHSSFLSVFL